MLPESARVEGGRLVLGGIPAADLAAEFGTPLYVYCSQTLRQRSAAFVEALDSYPGPARAVFACKANATVAVLAEVFAQGLGADVATEGELAAALRAGGRPELMVVHGNNKSDADIRRAVLAGAGLIVVDHAGELDQVEAMAAESGVVQWVAVRITPGIVADTHAKIVTGHDTSKFGLAPPDALDALDAAGALPHLEPAGLHVHVGSQIRDLGTYERVADWLVELISEHGLGDLPLLDLGGGFGIAHSEREIELPVPDAVEALVLHVAERLIAHGLPLPELLLEPGRSIAGPAGVTLYTVGAVKEHRRRDHLRRRRRRHVRQPAAGALRSPLRRDRLRPGRRPAVHHLCDRGQALRVGRRADRGRGPARAAYRRRAGHACHGRLCRQHGLHVQPGAAAGGGDGRRRPGPAGAAPRDRPRPACP